MVIATGRRRPAGQKVGPNAAADAMVAPAPALERRPGVPSDTHCSLRPLALLPIPPRASIFKIHTPPTAVRTSKSKKHW